MSILEGELAAEIGDALADVFIPATVSRSTVTGPPHNPTVTWTPYPCMGCVDSYELDQVAGTLIQANDRRVLITSVSLSIEPKPGDRCSIRGEEGAVISVGTDPAEACWVLQVRA